MKQLLLFLLLFCNIYADTTPEKRIALLVANANYEDTSILHIENDLFNLEIFLKQKNFEVITVEDVTKREMIKALRTFSEKLSESDIALFYFAGLSASNEYKSYLIPYESSIDESDEIAKESIELFKIVEKMKSSHNRVNMLLLDMNILEYIEISDATHLEELQEIKDVENFNYFADFTTTDSELIEDFIKEQSKDISNKEAAQNLSKKYQVYVNPQESFKF